MGIFRAAMMNFKSLHMSQLCPIKAEQTGAWASLRKFVGGSDVICRDKLA